MSTKVYFITNMCASYTVGLYERLAEKLDMEFYFTGGDEGYLGKGHKKILGRFKGEYLKGFFLSPKFRLTPGLLPVLFRRYDVLIKTIDDRFALPMTFMCAKLLRRPFIFWVGLWQHPQTLFHKLSYFLTKFIYRHSDAIVVYGEHVKRYLETLGIDDQKIFCAPHAVDNSCFNKEVTDGEKNRIRSEWNVSDEKILLFVGRLEPCKGLEYLLEGVSKVDSKTLMVFIGTGTLKGALEQKCRELGMNSRFLDLVPNDQLYRYYAVADVFILPSISTKDFKEPWGFVVNEAMNQGCPVITTDAVGAAIGGLVEHGKTGFIVKEKNAQAIQDAIQILCSDGSLRSNMSSHARTRIRSWTQEEMAQGFVNAVNYVRSMSKIPLSTKDR